MSHPSMPAVLEALPPSLVPTCDILFFSLQDSIYMICLVSLPSPLDFLEAMSCFLVSSIYNTRNWLRQRLLNEWMCALSRLHCSLSSPETSSLSCESD